MNGSSTQTAPARRSRRTGAAVFAMVALVIGVGLLWYSFVYSGGPSEQASAAPSPTTTLSPIAQTRTQAASAAPTLSPGATLAAPPVVVVTSYVPVPTYVNAPASSAQDSDTLALVTTVSGLLASLAGIVSAIVSVRAPRSR